MKAHCPKCGRHLYRIILARGPVYSYYQQWCTGCMWKGKQRPFLTPEAKSKSWAL